MQILNKTTNLNFMGHRVKAVGLSVLLLLGSIALLATNGLNLGVDFTGGAVIEVGYPDGADREKVRSQLAAAGFERASVQGLGAEDDLLIRLLPDSNVNTQEIGEQVIDILEADGDKVTLRRVDSVGPQVGEELKNQGGIAMLFALLMIFLYVWFRFQWKFSLGAIAALIHDVLITLGFFALSQVEFDLSVLAALLAVIGYSLNDTVVVFDRVRENSLRAVRDGDMQEIMNRSVNQMLARTIITGVTTLLVLIALFLRGGPSVHGFSVALIVGVIVGTYSSIFVACATALGLSATVEDLLPIEKKEEHVDELP